MPLPKITVVTPSYNQAAYLDQTIASVLDQGYANLEYIIIDGGSSDGSVNIIKKYASSLSYWVSEPDNGQYAAINKGLRRASGDIVCYINSDDYFEPGALQKVGSAFAKNPSLDLFRGAVNIVDDRGNPTGHHYSKANTLFELLDLWQSWWQGNQWIQPECFWRRKHSDQLNGFNESLYMVGDWDFWIRLLASEAIDSLGIDTPLVNFRSHADQKTTDRERVASEQLTLLTEYLDSPIADSLTRSQIRYLKSSLLYTNLFLKQRDHLSKRKTPTLLRWASLATLVLKNPALIHSHQLRQQFIPAL